MNPEDIITVANELNLPDGVAVIPTDTVYGLVARVDRPAAIERVYDLKERPRDKACIVLINDLQDLTKIGVFLSESKAAQVKQYWPGPVSIVLPAPKAPKNLRRSGVSVAVRMPDNDFLQNLLAKTGPLIAPSANPAGANPALTFSEAEDYFAGAIDIIVDGGELHNKPSTLIKILNNGDLKTLRK